MERTDRYWLIERTGKTRYVWGPFTLLAARVRAGIRHSIVIQTSPGLLEDGAAIPEGHIHAAFESGRLVDTH
jgi:hypothetical protein